MPPKSKAQTRLFRAVAAGSKILPGLSPEEAKEYVAAATRQRNYRNGKSLRR